MMMMMMMMNRCGYQSITHKFLKRCLIKDIVTTCFGIFRPSSGFHPKVWWWCFIGLVWLCHDGEISASVMFVIESTHNP